MLYKEIKVENLCFELLTYKFEILYIFIYTLILYYMYINIYINVYNNIYCTLNKIYM